MNNRSMQICCTSFFTFSPIPDIISPCEGKKGAHKLDNVQFIIEGPSNLGPKEIQFWYEHILQHPHFTGLTYSQLQNLLVWQAKQKDGEIVGMVALATMDSHFVEVGPIYVLKPYQGQGIGTRLLQIALTWTRENHKGIFLATHNDILSKMLAEYAHNLNLVFTLIDEKNSIKAIVFLLRALPSKAALYIISSRLLPLLKTEVLSNSIRKRNINKVTGLGVFYIVSPH